MKRWKTAGHLGRTAAFTLVEIIVVVVILGIAALIAVPMMSSAADVQVRGAANRLAADLEYAKNMAITHQKLYSVVFDTDAESYVVQDNTGTAIPNPVNPAQTLSVVFPNEHGLTRVAVESAAFVSSAGTDAAVTFDYLGTPYGGTTDDAANTLNSGIVTLRDMSGNFALEVRVEPMTGYVTIASP